MVERKNIKPKCLVVDDEEQALELHVKTLEPMGLECHTAKSIKQAYDCLQRIDFDLCLTDMRLQDKNGLDEGNGIDLVAYIQKYFPELPVAVITAYGDVESAVKALKAGAFDFVSKPIVLPTLRDLVENALRLSEKNNSTTLPIFISKSQIMEDLLYKIKKVARVQASIYITGETGSGKEVVARMIHGLSGRADKPFIPINCGAIPKELLESELFGHKKGSFTSAHVDKMGLFQAARGGTLFLDEIGDLPLLMQVKLLRAIQGKQIRPVGAQNEISVDVRILSATNLDLAELVEKGKFREDLFFRLNVINIHVPPLREHIEDVPYLVESILNRLFLQTSKNTKNLKRPNVSGNAKEALMEYNFPGNVRELENMLERAMALCENDLIETRDLKFVKNEIKRNEPKKNAEKNEMSLNPLTKEKILEALEKTAGNKTKAAKLLSIGFGALRYRLKCYGLSFDKNKKEK